MIQANTGLDGAILGAGGSTVVPIVTMAPAVKTSPAIEAPAKPASRTKHISVSMITPWKQECGNAEYAERLCVALDDFANVTPFDLRNFAEDFEMRSKSFARSYFDDLIARINQTNSDIVHIQHEFCFFGRSIQRSNSQFLRFVQRIEKPLVVTLHTWLDQDSKKNKRAVKSFLKNPIDAVRGWLYRKCLYKSLAHCESIVVHTHDTYTMIVSAYPQLRKKVSIVQIPIAPVEVALEKPPISKAQGDVWLVLPGFVSPYKGHLHAIGALEHLPENHKLVVAGGRHPKDRGAPRYWMELLKEIEERNLQSRVVFTGFLQTGSEQATVLRQADVFILPYAEVGQSGSAVLADSLAYDVPVITSHARSMFAYRMSQDTVFSSTSLDVTEPEALANCVIESLTKRASDSQTASHRKAAISRFSLPNIGNAYERLYMDVRSKAAC